MSDDAHRFSARKRVVVFGAGYVGSTVAVQAVEKGCEVTALTRNAQQADLLARAGVHVVTADLASSEWHVAIAGEADFVLNSVSAGGGGVEGYRRSYLEGMKSILRWAQNTAAAPLGAFVYTSSTSVYPQDGGITVDETSPIGPGGSETSQVLVEAEELARSFAPACARRAFVLRLAGIYGPGRHHLLDQLRKGETTFAGGGDHFLNLIHRDDIASAVWKAWLAPESVRGGTFNVVDDGRATKREVVTWLAQQLGLPVPTFSGEPNPARRRPVSLHRTLSNVRLKDVLGWRPAYLDFREGYRGLLGA